MRKANQERALAILSPLAVLMVWQICSDAGLISRRYVPSPVAIAEAAWALMLTGELWVHIGTSLYRLAVGFVIGAVPGVLLGMVMGLNRWVRAAVDPLVAALYPIPKIAILPLLMLLFGLGDGSKIAVVAASVLFLTIINTTVGVLQLDRIYFDVAKNYGTPWHKLFLRVILPGALPTIFAGLRISLGVSLVVLVGAEFVASRAGIGYLIWTSWETLVIEKMFVGIIVITILGVLTTFLLHECERLLIPWRRD
ncbi:MAG: ABC transporter permease [Rhodospirillaceae bacterium]|nr:ABC transporter permease [Rhodospirillaceae bacterium]